MLDGRREENIGRDVNGFTLSPLARLMARSGRSTRRTRRIFTTEIVPELVWKNRSINLECVKRAVQVDLPEEDRDQGHTNHQQVEEIESGAAESALVQNKAITD